MICKAFCSRIKDVIHHQCHKLYTVLQCLLPLSNLMWRPFFNFKVIVTESKFRVLHSEKIFLFVIISKYHSYLGSIQYCKYNPALGLTESCEREISLKYLARMDLVRFFCWNFQSCGCFPEHVLDSGSGKGSGFRHMR